MRAGGRSTTELPGKEGAVNLTKLKQFCLGPLLLIGGRLLLWKLVFNIVEIWFFVIV